MILSPNFLNKPAVILVAVLISLTSCSSVKNPGTRVTTESPGIDKPRLTAVLPIYNISGTSAPLKDIRSRLITRLKKTGLNILDEDVLEAFNARHRIRYVGGIDIADAEALRKETGAETVLITSLELYSELFPPKIALTSRLVSSGNTLSILWIKGVGLASDDSVGILGLGLIENFQVLLEKAVQQLSDSLSEYLASQEEEIEPPRKRFRPKVSYRSPVIDPELKHRIAVLPFINFSERKKAGEIIALNFVRQFSTNKNFDPIEPGVIHQVLLGSRIIMNDGLSLTDADLLFRRLEVDLILTGAVMDYQDYQGIQGKPKVDFSTMLIERKSREVVWSSKSYNEGDDGVFFFDWGRVNTAHAMASEMVSHVVEMIAEKNP